jgi:hypothetical protein
LSGCYLDTTIVVEAISVDGGSAHAIGAAIRSHAHASQAHYSLRELLAGVLRSLCEAHNELLGCENAGEALLALLKRVPAEGRKREARIRAVASALKAAFDGSPNASRDSMKREMLENLALTVVGMWKGAQSIRGTELTHALGCFPRGHFSLGPAGELRGPNDSFNCDPSARCSAAAYMADDEVALHKMIDALHPDKLPPELAQKRESSKRRGALKELAAKGPEKFDKGKCRALGDAFFAQMCPPGVAVLTTNISDFAPLCAALSKPVFKP